MRWLVLAAGIASNAGASLLIKAAAVRWEESGQRVAAVAPTLFAGLVLYGLAFAVYAYSLTLFPLHVAHPILTSGAIAAVAVASALLFHERLSAGTVLGLCAIGLGVALVARGGG